MEEWKAAEGTDNLEDLVTRSRKVREREVCSLSWVINRLQWEGAIQDSLVSTLPWMCCVLSHMAHTLDLTSSPKHFFCPVLFIYFWLQHADPSSPTRDLEAWSLNLWTTRGVPLLLFCEEFHTFHLV